VNYHPHILTPPLEIGGEEQEKEKEDDNIVRIYCGA
jgi:hypothetical protein